MKRQKIIKTRRYKLSDDLNAIIMKNGGVASIPKEEEEDAPNVEYRNGHIYFQSDVTNKSIDKLILLSEKHIKNNLFGFSKPDYYLHINSSGGEVYETLRFLDFVDNHIIKNCNEVVSIVEGVAMSAASMIAVSFPKRYMSKRAVHMIHEIQCGAGWGTLTHITKRAEGLKELQERLLDIYVSKTKLDLDTLKQMLLTEEYIFSDKAFEYGFVDKILN